MSDTASFKLRIASPELARIRNSAELEGVSVAEVFRRGARREARRILSLARRSPESAERKADPPGTE